MARPRMLVVAGPPGSGRTTYFPVTAFGIDSFNVDDRCAQIVGSYRAISREVRRAVAKERERFVREHIDQGLSFAVETTLRTTSAIDQDERDRGAVSFSPTNPLPRTLSEGVRYQILSSTSGSSRASLQTLFQFMRQS